MHIFNARSLRNKLPDLYSLLDGMLFNTKFDTIVICETWCNTNMPDDLLLFNNIDHFLLRRDRFIDGNSGCGVCAFIRNVFSFTQVNIPTEFDLHELLCFDVLIDNFKQRFTCVYRLSNASKQISERLFRCLDSFCDIDYVFTLSTDFNLPNFSATFDYDLSVLPSIKSYFTKFFADDGAHQLITVPMRLNNLLDFLTVNDRLAIFDVNVTSLFSTSDHNYIIWRTWFPNSTYAEGLCHRNFSKANYAAITSFFILY